MFRHLPYLRKVCLINIFLLIHLISWAQNQKEADSLIFIYDNSRGGMSAEKLGLLHGIAASHTVTSEKIKYAELLIEAADKSGNDFWLHKGFMELGSGYRLQGDLHLALESYVKCSEAAIRADYVEGVGGAYAAIADIYSINGNSSNAVHYYNRAIEILTKTDDSVVYASVLLNAGDEYFNAGKYDSALLYFEKSGDLFQNMDYTMGIAYTLGNAGMVYASTGKNELAEQHINKAVTMLEELQDFYPISVYLTYMADIYLEKGDAPAALYYAHRSLELAQQYGLKDQISASSFKLSELYENTGNHREAYRYYKDHILYRDSVNNIEAVQQMADLRTDFEVSRKQVEVDLLSQQKRNQRFVLIASLITAVLVFLLSLGLYRRNIYIKRTNRIIEEERNRSESLLLNILPEETARELKQDGKVQAKKFESATVLFTDFTGFTKIAEDAEPEKLVRSIDYYFKEFDKITTRYGLEKIKTIGDSYMCAGGLPKSSPAHARKVISAAQEMIDLVGRQLKSKDSLIHFEIRIGVHTGPVIAGIVGTKKWQYDIWGDTVNIASRMESNSETGKINLSETTYNEIKEEFPCEYRGKIDVKNRGSLKMYYLS